MRKCTKGFIAGSVPRRRTPQSEWASCDVLVFLQFVQHIHSQTGSDHASSLQHSLGSVSWCQETRCGFRGTLRIFSEKNLRSDLYLTSCPWDVRRNGFRSSCTVHRADRCNEVERHIFTTSCWKPARSLCSTSRSTGPQNCQRNTQAIFHDCTEGKRRHRGPEYLQQSAFILWFNGVMDRV